VRRLRPLSALALRVRKASTTNRYPDTTFKAPSAQEYIKLGELESPEE
jgi:hypothetical protein